MMSLLADVVLLAHVCFAAYNLLGLLLIWAGGLAGWSWVRGRWFRGSHLAAMGFVVAESIAGMVCPLTRWESRLRAMAGEQGYAQQSFMRHWAERFFYYDVPPQVFTVCYVAFFIAMLLTLWLVPVSWRPQRGRPGASGKEMPPDQNINHGE